MHPSYQVVMGNQHEGMSDKDFWDHEVRLAELCEPLGFSSVWCVEHHFDGDYSMVPDNLQFLTYLAGRTNSIKLVTGGIIVPWNDPLRIVSKVVMLDYLSNGRAVLGLGRGLSRMEYEQFGIDMNEARERFDEATEMILRGLATGVVSGDGPYYPQPPATIRPAPTRDFRDELVCIAMSPDSLDVAAKLGAQMATFIQFPVEMHLPAIEQYRETYRSTQGKEPPPPVLTEFVYCHEDSDTARETAEQYLSRYLVSVLRHYELDKGHFADIRGYQAYAVISDMIAAAGREQAAADYANCQTWGTPEEIVDKIHAKRAVVGDYHLNCAFSYAGMPFDQVEASMRLFADKVIPELKRL
jgi:alkanesulfonate monooxygenase SsuD/methylene tetrahydromethanopterin reductase-like flavin-dependent oxidoreductase (luciferase family)